MERNPSTNASAVPESRSPPRSPPTTPITKKTADSWSKSQWNASTPITKATKLPTTVTSTAP